MSKQYSDTQRYTMWKEVISNVRGKVDRGSVWGVYLEQINKCQYQHEFDSVLDAIIFNEKNRMK
jgi:hypothetical protein